MKRTVKQIIEYNLNSIPYGTLLEHTLLEEGERCAQLPVEMKTTLNGKGLVTAFPLYPGIFLSFFDISADQVLFRGKISDEIMEINFCRYGRVGLELDDKNMLYLGPGDFSIHMVPLGANSTLSMPLGYCEGVSVYIDLKKLSEHPPELLRGIGVTGEFLKEKFCHDGASAVFPSGERTGDIFSGMFDLPEGLRLAYYKLRVLELLLYLYQIPPKTDRNPSQYRANQIETVKNIHTFLMDNLDKRITIDELSRRYLMNTTTLKAVFKTVYGSSIAAHIKEHRLEKAASLLLETEKSVAQIAHEVGYESQSKLTVAFKEIYGMSPSDFRRR